jgi:teichuronic acid exporter
LSSLKSKSFLGVTWSFIDSFAGSGVSFFIGIILARILPPSDFGLIGMISVFLAISNTFIDSGFSSGLIRKMKCEGIEFDTVFWFNAVIAIIFYFLLFISAPIISRYFGEPKLAELLKVLGLVVIIDSLSLVQRAIFIRDINFKIQTKVSLTASLTGGIIGIVAAFKGLGVWSLVLQTLLRQAIMSILLWTYSKWRPLFRFSKQAFLELFDFGSKILGSNMIITIQNNIYYFVIGKVFSSSGLGFYTRAEQFNSIVTNNITGTMDRVFFPVLASIQNDDSRLMESLKKTLRTSFFVTYFVLIGMAITAKPLIYILVGPKWDQSVPYLQLICIGSVFFPFNVINMNILKIRGRSDLILKLQVIKTSLIAINIVAGIFYGITAMLGVRIITTLFATLLNSYYSGKMLKYSILTQIKDISPYFISENIIFLPMILIMFVFHNVFLCFSIQAVLGIILFFLIFELRKHEEYIEIKKLVIELLSKKLPWLIRNN